MNFYPFAEGLQLVIQSVLQVAAQPGSVVDFVINPGLEKGQLINNKKAEDLTLLWHQLLAKDPHDHSTRQP